jgi:hypothetical protein
VAAGVFEMDGAAAVASAEFAALALRGIGPVGKLAAADPREDLVEFGLADEECVVLRGVSRRAYSRLSRSLPTFRPLPG